jgi:phospholipid/cholesterol/gamma-HCH transport system permease protein
MNGMARTWISAFRGDGPDTALDRAIQDSGLFRPLETASEIASLGWRVLKTIFTPPFSWVREAVVESSHIVRLVTLSVMFASFVYVLAFGSVLFGQIIYALGAADRVGPGIYVGLLRELGTWLTYMVLAGIAGSALAGDLGARKIREELDALDVLGVDKIRTLIVPRVVAITFAGLLLSLLVVIATELAVLALDTLTIHQSFATQWNAVGLIMNPYDIGAAVVKHTILGFFVGIVACQKGLSAKGGGEGVGRAVAETVLITFFGIWLINSLFNTGYLTVFPNALGIKG